MPNSLPGGPNKGSEISEKRIGYYILGIGLLFCLIILLLDINSYNRLMEKVPRKPGSRPIQIDSVVSNSDSPSRQISAGLNNLELAKGQFGPDSAQVAENLQDMADLYHRNGMNAEAESHYKEAVALWEKVVTSNRTQSAKSMASLGMLYSDQNRSAEAEQLLVRAISIWNDGTGTVDPVAKAGLETLATLYENTGRFAEAEKLRQQVSGQKQQDATKGSPPIARPSGVTQ